MAETILTSSHVVDTRANAMLESEPWNDIVDALIATYLSVYAKDDDSRPKWLDQREEVSNLALSFSTRPLTAPEIKAVATTLSKEHSFGGACKAWAVTEAKWLLGYLNGAATLMAGFMALPALLANDPGVPAPEGHSHAGLPMRAAMVHSAFRVLAVSRRVQAVMTVGGLSDADFDVLSDGSVVKKRAGAALKAASTAAAPRDEGAAGPTE